MNDMVIIAAASRVARARRRMRAAVTSDEFNRATFELLDAVDELVPHFMDSEPRTVMSSRRETSAREDAEIVSERQAPRR